MPVHEEVNDKSVNLAVRVGKLTASELRKAIDNLLAKLSDKSPAPGKKSLELKHGKQTLKQLSKHNDGLSTVELKDPNLRQLHRAMKRHNVDFAAVRDGKGKYTLFFKGKDADAITHAFKQYTQKLMERGKPSINATLAAAKAAAQTLNVGRDTVKNKDKGAR